MRVMFIDPGLGGTGWAFWDNFPACFVETENTGKAKHFKIPPRDEQNIANNAPHVCGVIKTPKDLEWIGRALKISEQCMDLFINYKPELLGIENPELWSGSAVSQSAAAKGNLGKLSFLVGCISHSFYSYDILHGSGDATQILFTPREWKGQLSKEMVIRRIQNYWAINPSNHEADAVGMGLHFLGGL